MKKIWLAALAAAAILGGCTMQPTGPQEVTDREMTVTLPEGEATGLFTGTMERNRETEITTAQGVWTAQGGWRYEGLITDGVLTAGNVADLPCAVTFGADTLTGVYNGPVAAGLPDGDGSFAAGEGVTFTGSFAAGAAGEGTVESLPVTVAWQGAEYSGAYSGAISQGLPSGRGTFTGADPARENLAWEGGWAAGLPAGEGQLTADRLTVTLEGETLVGGYTGGGLDGLPAGEGSFAAVTGEGIPLTYEGAWAAGLMEGQGTLRFDSENYYLRAGTFTAGAFTPTWLETLKTLGTCEPEFTLTAAQEAFIARYPDLWEAQDHQRFLESAYAAEYDRGLTLQGCLDDPQGFPEEPRWMCLYSLRTIRADTVTVGTGAAFTCITATDSTYTRVVRVILPEALPSITRAVRFHIYAVPLAVSSYTTVLGTEQPCLVMLAGDIYVGQ